MPTLDNNLGAAFGTPVNVSLKPWTLTALQVVQDDGTLLKLSDTKSPLDKQASLKITNTKIANVYNTLAKGAIPVGNQALNTSGQSIFVELTAAASKVVGTDTFILPVQARIEVRLPNDGDMTEANVVELIMATMAAMYDSTGVPRITGMMRGILKSPT